MKTKTKIVLGLVVVAGLLIFVLSQFYVIIHRGTWYENNAAVETVIATTYLTKVDRVESFHGDQSLKIIYGEDHSGQQAIAWLSDNEIHTERATDGVSKDELKSRLLQNHPDARLLRAVPGKLGNDYIWELYYQKPDASGKKHFYYDYYKFADGSLIDTYDLGTK